MAFVFPSALRDLERDSDEDEDHSRLCARSPIDVAGVTPSDLEVLVKGVVFDLSDKELFCVEEQGVFNRVYSLVRDFSVLPPNYKSSVLESLRSNLSVLLPNVDSLSRSASSSVDNGVPCFADHVVSHRNAFKIYTFFILTIAVSEESNGSTSTTTTKAAASSRKKNYANSWNWEFQRGRLFNLIASSIEIDLSLLFGSPDLDENYLSFVCKCAFSMFEHPHVLRDQDTKNALSRIVGTCSAKYHYTTQSCASILRLLHKFDFVPTHIADAIAAGVKKYSDGSLAVSVIREIGRANPKDYTRDTAGADNIGRFLVELADRLPKLISMNMGILIPHFGGESYKIRNALIGVLGKLVAKAFKDVEGDASSKAVRLRNKQAMLDILLERCKDVSAYTRSRVLQVWSDLCEQYCVSIGLWNEVASVAAGRLEDKSAIVRKSALNLLITMLQHNPFGPQLRVVSFEATLEKYRERLRGLEPDEKSSEAFEDDLADEYETSRAESEIEQAEPDGAKEQESVSDSVPSSITVSSGTNSDVVDSGNLEETRTLVASLEAGLRFSKCLSSAMPTLVQLLASSSASDVESTIHLLMRCRQFQIDGSEACLKKILPLVFSLDKSIYEAVETAFLAIYVKNTPPETAKSLLSLAIEANIGDLAALEFIVGVLVSKRDISTTTISALWDFFCFNIRGVTAEQSRGALSVLCMAARTTPEILSNHLQDIIDVGFGRWAKVEPLLARTACIALERLAEADKIKLLSNYARKVFGTLERVILSFELQGNVWYAAAEKAINAIYALHPTPEVLAAEIVKKSVSSLFKEDVELEMPIRFDFLSSVKVASLSKFLFVISHVAMNQLVYIDVSVRKVEKQKNSNKSSASVSNGKEAEVVDEEAGINAELGLNASEDAILDHLSERAGHEIVSCGSDKINLIGYSAPFVSKLCRNFGLTQKFPELQASGVLALCRLMIIDADFCEQNLQLLFTIVENSPSENVRSNCIIALGDLTVRFPNLLEPWTENIYACLRDSSSSVRKNAVLVLSHLILNDMMKVKGYIFEMAMRLEDDDDRISSLAKLFFNELSKKGNNPIYNLLPDILGRLSNQNLQKEIFCSIMQFLIGSIKKDKQMEALVEKLCNRFSTATDNQQWQHIAYCLSQLTFTEKGIKKLMESFKSYENALYESSVMDYFKNIIQKAKKFAKPDTKTSVEEFEEKLNKFRMDKMAQEETANNARVHQENCMNIMSFGAAVRQDENLDSDSRNESGVQDGGGEVIDPPSEELEAENNSPESRESQVRYRSPEIEQTDQKGASKSRRKKLVTNSKGTERKSTYRSRTRRN